MGVRRYPGAASRERRQARPDMQVVLEKARVRLRTVQELAPSGLVAFQAGQFEACEALSRWRIVRSVDSGYALEPDAIELIAHMREACLVAIEVDEIDLHR